MTSISPKTAHALKVLLGSLFLIIGTLTTDVFADQIVLKKGTNVKLRLGTTVSSNNARIGDPIEVKVLQDVKIGDVIVIPAGSKGRGFVAKAESDRLFGAGTVSIYVGSVAGPAGLQVPVYGQFESTNNSGDATLSEGAEAAAEVQIDVPIDTESIPKVPGDGESDRSLAR